MSGTYRDQSGQRMTTNRDGEPVAANTRRINARPSQSRGFGGLAEFYQNQRNLAGAGGTNTLPSLRQSTDTEPVAQPEAPRMTPIQGTPVMGMNLGDTALAGSFRGMHSGSIIDAWDSVNSRSNLAGGFIPLSDIAGARKDGGPVDQGSTYLVNEDGMEAFWPFGGIPQLLPGGMSLFSPRLPGQVLPAPVTRRLIEEGEVQPPAPAPTPAPRQQVRVANADQINPYALRHVQQRSAPGTYGAGAGYGEIFEAAERRGIDMTNAPDNLPALQRYVRMGLRQQDAHRQARAAVAGKIAEQQAASQAGVGPPITRYGTGSRVSQSGPGLFALESGEMVPLQDWRLDNAVEQRVKARANAPEPKASSGKRKSNAPPVPSYSWEEVNRMFND